MRKRKGFTLVELLAVIVILAIVLIIAVPGVLSSINKTKNNAYESQLKIIKEAAKNYIVGERSSVVWEGTDPAVTIVSLTRMKEYGYLDKKIVDPRDQSELKHLAVEVKKDASNSISYEIIETTTDEIELPHITDALLPIVYDGSKWVKADSTNKNHTWYDYDNHFWANVATVTESTRTSYQNAPIGTEIKMEDINTMFTWIPRFKYKLWNVDGTVKPVGNKNLAGDYLIDIQFETASTPKSTGSQNGQWLTHPAFTFGGEELSGFWLAKFDVAVNSATTKDEALLNAVEPNKIVIKPNTIAWRSITIKKIHNTIQGMKNNQVFGLTDANDPHLTKNIEWGAMAYLTYSPYGKAGNYNYSGEDKQVRINNNNIYTTGCGADSQDAPGVDTCHTYETEHGQAASTTGNISGLYDISGGTNVYVAGVPKLSNGTDFYTGGSEFTQAELNQLVQEGKYFDSYEYSDVPYVYTNGKLGDATIEAGPFENAISSWYKDYGYFPNMSKNSWFIRGGQWHDGTLTGPMDFSVWDGGLNSGVGYMITLL